MYICSLFVAHGTVACTVFSRGVLKICLVHMEYVTEWRDSLAMIENIWLHCNLGSLSEETISPVLGPLGDTFRSNYQ